MSTHLCDRDCNYDNFYAPTPDSPAMPIFDRCPECGTDISSLFLSFERVDEYVEKALDLKRFR